MPERYDFYDESGNRLGSAERQPNAAEQIIGAFILFWLVWQLLVGTFWMLVGIGQLIVWLVRVAAKHPRVSLPIIAASVVIVGTLVHINYRNDQIARAVAAEQVRQLERQATATAEAVNAARRQTEMALARLKEQGVIIMDNGRTQPGPNDTYFLLDRVEFAPEGIRVYLRSRWPESAGTPCVFWRAGQNAIRSGEYREADPAAAVFPVHSDLKAAKPGVTAGYLLYPYSIVGPDRTYYFQFGCSPKGGKPQPQIPIFDTRM